MANDVVVKGSIGARLEVTILLDGAPYDLTGATVTFLFRKPGGASGAWSAAVTDAAAGRARFVTSLSTTLDTVGRWELQPKIVTGSGEILYGDAVRFYVSEVLQ